MKKAWFLNFLKDELEYAVANAAALDQRLWCTLSIAQLLLYFDNVLYFQDLEYSLESLDMERTLALKHDKAKWVVWCLVSVAYCFFDSVHD